MEDHAFELRVDHDEMEARVRIADREPGLIEERQDLLDALRNENVTAGIDEEAIAKAFERLAETDAPGEEFLVARGKSPRHGRNGDIEFKVDVSGQAVYQGAEAEEAAVDFREATTVTSVEAGETIAELIPPTDGEDGFNLAGKTLPARKGKPAKLRAGEGVDVEEDGRLFKAARQGRPVYSAGTIVVSDVYQVPGDVDFNTGNIKFRGHVIVQGNVQDDFSVEAQSVEVMGVVGASRILCRGPLQVRGGINGRDKAEITVGADAHCKYVNQCKIVVSGNLMIAREAVNSRIWCQGKVKAEKIIGGECLALGGIEANILGSDMGVSTTLEPGANFEVRRLDEAMAALAERIEALIRPVQPYFDDRARYRALPEEKKEAFRKSYEDFVPLKDNYVKLAEERNRILDASDYQPVKQVIARKLVHHDVFVRTELCMRQFKKQITGPVALIEDIDASTIRPAPYVPGKGIVEEDEEDAED